MKIKKFLCLLFSLSMVMQVVSSPGLADSLPHQIDVDETPVLSIAEISLAGETIEIPVITCEKEVQPYEAKEQHTDDNAVHIESAALMLVPTATEEAIAINERVVTKIKEQGGIIPLGSKVDTIDITVVHSYVWCFSNLSYSYYNVGSARYYDINYFSLNMYFEAMTPFDSAHPIHTEATLKQIGAIEGGGSAPAQIYDVPNVQSGTKYYAPSSWVPSQSNSFTDVGVVYFFTIDFADNWYEDDTSFCIGHRVA